MSDMPSIIDLPEVVKKIRFEDKELFDCFFDINLCVGRLVLPEEMKPWAKKVFGSISDVENQKIISVFNKLTFETALFNELRAKRPIDAKSDENAEQIIKNSVGDPFCNPLKMTPADSFGRVKGKYCVSASNVAKYDGLHGLIVFKNHNPLDFREKELQDYFKTALKWFDKAYKKNNQAVYPFILWNCLWKAAASIIHGHMQLVLGEKNHYAEAEYLNKIRKEYADKHKTDYFADLFKCHETIGLGLEKNGLKIFSNITPRKEKEITIISDKLDKDYVNAIFKITDSLVKDFGVMSFNLAIILPPMVKSAGWKGFPVITRIVDRGKLSNKTADIGGMELYARSNVIGTDPYKVFEKIKNYF